MSGVALAVAVVAGSFLAGSIPFGYLVPRFLRGLDIRGHGSRNPGATNVWRVLGPGPGVLVGLLDGAKGWLAVALAIRAGAGAALSVAAALAAVAGHSWTPWLAFRGGKGVITSAGAFLRLAWLPLAGAVVAFGVVFAATRMVSAGSIVAAVLFAVLTVVLPGPWRTPPVELAAGLIALLIVIRHRANISRILAGTEYRFGRKAAGR
ncbi:MAG: glycerol-3-phosphate 1-O-acyltransferase PlsY [Candidatus Coatesbacteria bacterium]